MQLAVQLVAELLLAAEPGRRLQRDRAALRRRERRIELRQPRGDALRQTCTLGRLALELPQLAQRARVKANLLTGLPPRLVQIAARDQPLRRARADRLGALLAGGQAAMELQRVKLTLRPSAVLAALADRWPPATARAAPARRRCAGGSARAGR